MKLKSNKHNVNDAIEDERMQKIVERLKELRKKQDMQTTKICLGTRYWSCSVLADGERGEF